MRSTTLAILGLAAATHALPAREARGFTIGDSVGSICISNNCGSSGGGSGTILTPDLNRRSTGKHDVEKLYDTLVKLLSSKEPSFPVYMVAEQLVQLLLQEGFEFDPKILGAWTKFKVGRRQDGIFALPGSCDAEDVIGLQATLATILLVYGPDPPASIESLRNAVTAALIFCKVAPDPDTEFTPEIPVEGGEVVVEEPEEGNIEIDEGEEGSIEIN